MRSHLQSTYQSTILFFLVITSPELILWFGVCGILEDGPPNNQTLDLGPKWTRNLKNTKRDGVVVLMVSC